MGYLCESYLTTLSHQGCTDNLSKLSQFRELKVSLIEDVQRVNQLQICGLTYSLFAVYYSQLAVLWLTLHTQMLLKNSVSEFDLEKFIKQIKILISQPTQSMTMLLQITKL